jgi:hypothetical protein
MSTCGLGNKNNFNNRIPYLIGKIILTLCEPWSIQSVGEPEEGDEVKYLMYHPSSDPRLCGWCSNLNL